MSIHNKPYVGSCQDVLYMPEFGLYGKKMPGSCFKPTYEEVRNKSKIELEQGSVDVKTLAEQFKSMEDEIETLNGKIEKLEKENSTIPENTLIEFWDNEYDDQWDEC